MRAGWPPALVFLFHILILNALDVYAFFPSVDIPMHFVGGVAIAYFFWRLFAALPERAVDAALRPLAAAIFVVSLTATSAMLWEFAEFTSDALFGTQVQVGIADTMLDMALGLTGGIFFVLIAWRLRIVGSVLPVGVRVKW